MDFSQVKIHCSSLGVLFTQPKAKAAKDAGELSETAKTHLIKVYAKEYWGRERRVETKQMAKGTQQEYLGIELVSDIHGAKYSKNTVTLENEYIIGTPDIIHVPLLKIIDIKCSWDADTFLSNIEGSLDTGYYAQIQGYLYLSGMDLGIVSYCLVDATQKQIMDEQRKLLYSMDVATEENPEYIQACKEVERQMTFSDIPKHERVIDKIANRDEDFIAQIPSKVIKARMFLKEFHEKHTLLNRK